MFRIVSSVKAVLLILANHLDTQDVHRTSQNCPMLIELLLLISIQNIRGIKLFDFGNVFPCRLFLPDVKNTWEKGSNVDELLH